MSRVRVPATGVGNDFVVRTPRVKPAVPVMQPAVMPVLTPAMAAPSVQSPVAAPIIAARDFTPPAEIAGRRVSPFEYFMDTVHRHSLAAFALLFLLVSTSGIQVASVYWAAHVVASQKAVAVAAPVVATVYSNDMVFKSSDAAAKIQTIASQPAAIVIAGQTLPISADTVKSWLQTTPTADHKKVHVEVKKDAVEASINGLVSKYVKAPVNQVTATYADRTSAVIAAGANGSKLTDPAGLKQQIDTIGKNLMVAKGFQLQAPTEVQPFAAVTPAAYDKLIEVNVVTKQMYLYDHGQLWKSYPVSAGAPATPTPIGQYKIFSKLPVQDMKGFNPNGTPYFQPHVRWINYFLPGGYAVHGNYWRPLSWFGNINSSHGCVSIPDDQAKEVYDWAPLGTTVITHT